MKASELTQAELDYLLERYDKSSADMRRGIVASLICRCETYRQALLDIQGHGVTLPAQKAVTMTDEEKRWYARGLDSQRRIAMDALEIEEHDNDE